MTVTAALIASIAEVDLQSGQSASANGGEPQCFGKGWCQRRGAIWSRDLLEFWRITRKV